MRRILLLLLFLIVFLPNAGASGRVVLNMRGIPPVYRGIIFSVVMRVSREAFGTDSLKNIVSHREYYENGLKEVLNKVISGYSVRKLSIKPLSIGIAVNVDFTPHKRRFASVKIKLPPFVLLPKEVKELLLKDMAGAEEKLLPIVTGIPIDSMEWGEDILLHKVDMTLRKLVPGFRISSYVEVRRKTLVLRLSPVQPLVLNVDVELFSESIPVILLREQRAQLNSVSSFLSGLPVKWVKFHIKEIRGYIIKKISTIGVMAKYDTTVVANVSVGRFSRVDVQVESNRYRIKIMLAAYVGAGDRHTEVNIHFGYKPMSMWEVYGSFWVDVDDFSTRKFFGLSYMLNPCWTAGFEYNIDTSTFRFKTIYIWGGRKMAEGFYNLDGTGAGVMVGYRITEHMRVDLVYNSTSEKTVYIRVSNNL